MGQNVVAKLRNPCQGLLAHQMMFMLLSIRAQADGLGVRNCA
jgi:hypothetical protein